MVRVHSSSSLDAEEKRESRVNMATRPSARKLGMNSQGSSPYKDIGKGLDNAISPSDPLKVVPPYRAPSGPRQSDIPSGTTGQTQLPIDFLNNWPMHSEKNCASRQGLPPSSRGHVESSIDEGRSDFSGNNGTSYLNPNNLRKSARPFDLESTQ